MILNILIFKNLEIDAFTTPQFDDHEPEVAAVQLARALKIEKDWKKVAPYRALQLYVVGKFDDSTGIITVEKPRMLVDCSSIVKERDDYVESGKIERN